MLELAYDADGIKLYHGDCMELVPTLDKQQVAIVTDPPYGIAMPTAYKSRGRGCLTACNDFAPVYGDDSPFDPAAWLDFRTVVLFGANHYGDRLPASPSWLVWDKRDGMNPNDNADCELAWSNLGGPARLLHHRWNGMLKASERRERRVHPTQKPVALFEWIFQHRKFPKDALIVDPYAGSGPVLLAARNMGRDAIGVEIVREYVDVIIRRLEAPVASAQVGAPV